jgi:protein involved in polysaccharide export with SLBB domain
MRELWGTIQQAARVDITVLLRGETGTGKDIVARAIHACSSRRAAPFVKVNCAAVPHDLLESELFGHERGAFTGAHQLRIGKFEAANRGTVFLDEIGELHPALQAKLLHILQDGSFSRVGGKAALRVDVRVLAATNRNLERAVAEERFRQDLYYRLNVIQIMMPPFGSAWKRSAARRYFARGTLRNRGEFTIPPRRSGASASITTRATSASSRTSSAHDRPRRSEPGPGPLPPQSDGSAGQPAASRDPTDRGRGAGIPEGYRAARRRAAEREAIGRCWPRPGGTASGPPRFSGSATGRSSTRSRTPVSTQRPSRRPRRTDGLQHRRSVMSSRVFASLMVLVLRDQRGRRGGAQTSTVPPAAAPAAKPAGEPQAAPDLGEYRIGPEDVLQISVWRNEAMSRTVPVRPDGRISLPLLNDVQAGGLTPSELRDALIKKLAEYMPNPEVSVIVLEARSFKVSVIGEVPKPGRFELKSWTTVLDVLAMAGGLNQFAARGSGLRDAPRGKGHARIPFNYNKAVASPGEQENFYLRPGDIVVVP